MKRVEQGKVFVSTLEILNMLLGSNTGALGGDHRWAPYSLKR